MIVALLATSQIRMLRERRLGALAGDQEREHRDEYCRRRDQDEDQDHDDDRSEREPRASDRIAAADRQDEVLRVDRGEHEPEHEAPCRW